MSSGWSLGSGPPPRVSVSFSLTVLSEHLPFPLPRPPTLGYHFHSLISTRTFPGGSDGKEIHLQCGRPGLALRPAISTARGLTWVMRHPRRMQLGRGSAFCTLTSMDATLWLGWRSGDPEQIPGEPRGSAIERHPGPPFLPKFASSINTRWIQYLSRPLVRALIHFLPGSLSRMPWWVRRALAPGGMAPDGPVLSSDPRPCVSSPLHPGCDRTVKGGMFVR